VYYLNGILIIGITREEHAQNLRSVMVRLQKFGLRVSANQCKYFQSELKFLGRVVTPSGLRKDAHWKWTPKCQEAFERAKSLVNEMRER